MKKLFTLFFICFVSCLCFAQITITQSDMPSIGTVVHEANDTTSSISPGPSGANQTWNFISLINNYSDTVSYLNSSQTPYASSYPNSNLCQYKSAMGSSYIYLNSTANTLDIHGYVIGTMNIKLAPVMQSLTFPSTYLTSFNGTYGYQLVIPIGSPIDSVKVKTIVTYTSTIDSWGNVTTLTGTYNSIRQHLTEHHLDSTWAYISTPALGWVFSKTDSGDADSYTWWANGMSTYVLEMRFEGNDTTATYMLGNLTSVQKNNIHDGITTAYPNPFHGNTTVKINKDLKNKTLEFTMYDLVGSEVQKKQLVQEKNEFVIERGNLAEGMYFYKLTHNGEIIATGKLTIE